MELKRIAGRPRNISRVLDNHVDIPDGRSTNINTTNVKEMQIDERIKCICACTSPSHPSRLPVIDLVRKLPFREPAFSYDYQLSPKRFMIETVTSVESNALHLAEFKWIMTLISPYNPRPSPVKWGGLNTFLTEFQQPSDCRRVLVMSSTTGTRGKTDESLLNKYLMCRGILMMYSQRWDFKAGVWPSPCDSPTFHLSNFLFTCFT